MPRPFPPVQFLIAVLLAGAIPNSALALGCPTAQEVRDRLKIEYLDGMFVVGRASPHGNVMLRLAAYAAAPHMVDEPRIGSPRPYAIELALDILGRGWEHERAYSKAGLFNITTGTSLTPSARDVLRQFIEACGPTMTEVAPKPPFYVVFADPDTLGFYDDARGGLSVREPPDYTSNSYYTDFLTPKETHQFVEGSTFWPMAKEESEALFARLEAAASRPSAARQVQSVAVVEAQTIDPELRVAEVRLAAYGLYTNDFSERLYDYASAEAQGSGDPPATAPSSQPLGEGYYVSANEARAKALALCEAHTPTTTAMDCSCVADVAATGWAADPSLHIYTHLNNAVLNSSFDCADQAGAQAAALETCKMSYDEGHPFTAKLGPEKYCQCYADREADLGAVEASVSCSFLDEYTP